MMCQSVQVSAQGVPAAVDRLYNIADIEPPPHKDGIQPWYTALPSVQIFINMPTGETITLEIEGSDSLEIDGSD